MIRTLAYARAGFLGNPSDGYGGKTLAMTFLDFRAEVRLIPSPEFRIRPAPGEPLPAGSARELVARIRQYGYYGGERIVQAVIKRFFDYCDEAGTALGKDHFTLEFDTTIPRQLGLAGSSALATAALRALTAFYGVTIPREDQPSLLLAAETEELGIQGGLMDRVAQVYEGLVYMDLAEGRYESLDPGLLPDLYVAYRPSLSKVSGRVLSDIRARFDRGDLLVIDTLRRIAGLAEEGKTALLAGDETRLMALMDENFDLRCTIMEVGDGNRALVKIARGCGASAKLTGSGGAIIGIYRGEKMYGALKKALGKIGATVIKPRVV